MMLGRTATAALSLVIALRYGCHGAALGEGAAVAIGQAKRTITSMQVTPATTLNQAELGSPADYYTLVLSSLDRMKTTCQGQDVCSTDMEQYCGYISSSNHFYLNSAAPKIQRKQQGTMLPRNYSLRQVGFNDKCHLQQARQTTMDCYISTCIHQCFPRKIQFIRSLVSEQCNLAIQTVLHNYELLVVQLNLQHQEEMKRQLNSNALHKMTVWFQQQFHLAHLQPRKDTTTTTCNVWFLVIIALVVLGSMGLGYVTWHLRQSYIRQGRINGSEQMDIYERVFFIIDIITAIILLGIITIFCPALFLIIIPPYLLVQLCLSCCCSSRSSSSGDGDDIDEMQQLSHHLLVNSSASTSSVSKNNNNPCGTHGCIYEAIPVQLS